MHNGAVIIIHCNTPILYRSINQPNNKHRDGLYTRWTVYKMDCIQDGLYTRWGECEKGSSSLINST